MDELAQLDPARGLDQVDVTVEEAGDDLADAAALFCQADAHRAAIALRANVVDEAALDELLQIVRHVRTKIVAARAQLAGGQLLFADVEQKQGLDAVHVRLIDALEFVLDDVEQ